MDAAQRLAAGAALCYRRLSAIIARRRADVDVMWGGFHVQGTLEQLTEDTKDVALMELK